MIMRRFTRVLRRVRTGAIRPLMGSLLIASGMSAQHAAASDAVGQSRPHDVYIRAGWLLDIPGKPPKRDQTIVVRDARIVAVRSGFESPPAGATVIDLRHAHVLPGLIDCHVHLTAQMTQAELGPEDRLQTVTLDSVDRTLDGVVFARRTLEAGFTTVRDLGADARAIFGLRNAIEAGKIPGPRIVAAGQALSITGGDGDINGFRADLVFPAQNICDGRDDCRRAVRHQIKLGADVIKVIAAGGALGPQAGSSRQVSDDELEEIVRTAHELGRKVAAHAHGAAGIKAALRAGVDSIEHGTHIDDEAVELLRTRGAYFVPTLLAGHVFSQVASESSELPAAIRGQVAELGTSMEAALGRAHRAGLKIAFGSDSGVSPHGDNAKEFALMRKAGLSAMEALRAATVDAAELLGLASEIGTIEPGKAADLVAFRADPLADVENLTEPVFVMRAGQVYADKAERDCANCKAP